MNISQIANTCRNTYLGIDPGGKINKHSVGVAAFNRDTRRMVYIGQLTGDEFSDFLNAWKKDRHPFQVVCEEYIQLPFKKTNWFNKQQVIRCIGAIELKCKEFDVPLIMQQSNILPMAQKHFQVEMPKNHDATHQFAAYLHGAEYLFRAGLKQSQLETELADASSKKEE